MRLIEMRQDVVSGSGQAICGSSVSAGAVDDDIAPGYGTQCSEVSLLSDSSRSAIPAVTSPLVVPTRGHLDSIRRLMTGDRYIGRGSKQRALVKSIFHNPFKVSEYGRDLAIQLFEQHLDSSRELQRQIPSLSGTRLVCHCKQQEDCHADALIRKFKELFPDAYDRSLLDQRPPTSSELNLLARQREEVASDEGSSPDEGAPPKGSGWQGTGKPMLVGVGYTSREYCDGQTLASPGRWPVTARRYPQSVSWKSVVACFSSFCQRRCTAELLMQLALGRVSSCPFADDEIRHLKEEVIATLATAGIGLFREEGDRKDLPIDFRFLDLLLRAAEDPEVGLGKFAMGVRVGPGVRMPRLPALYRPKRKWRLASQADPLEYLEEDASAESTWRRNYASVGELTKQVLEVMDDQARRGQLIKLSEAEAKARFPNLVVASLGANRKDKPGGALTARVLFDGTHGLKLNTRTRIRDQERAPISFRSETRYAGKGAPGDLDFRSHSRRQ